MADTETDPQAHAGSVHVPGIGPVKKKTALYGTVAAVLAVLVYIYMKNRQSAAAAASPATGAAATVTDPAGNVCATLDPSSGYCPGSAEDQAYYSENNSGVLPGGSGSSDIIGYDQNGNPIYSSGGTGVTAATGPGSFTNNAQWAQYAEQGMGSSGNDAIAAALGKYITGGEVTADQITDIDEAIAIAGYPPTQGPGGKPPSINQAGAPGGGNPPPPTGNTVTVPRVISDRVEDANSALQSLGLKSTFGPRKPNVPYHVTAQSPAAGAKVKSGSTVKLTIAQGD